MKRPNVTIALAPAVLMLILSVPTLAVADEKARLSGAEEVPAISTTGSGDFRARIRDGRIEFELSYANLEGAVTQAHIHFGQRGVNGGVSVFLCTNVGGPAVPNPPPACPASPGTVTGVREAGDVIGPAGQGIAAGEFAELVEAIEDGLTYVNVHSDKHPAGEIRGQVR